MLRSFIAVLLLAFVSVPTIVVAEDATEQLFWESVKDADDPAEIEAYLEQYPDGSFAAIAKIRLKKLKGPNDAATEEDGGGSTPSTSAKSEDRPVLITAKPNDYRLTDGNDVNIYSEPDTSSKLRAEATIPRFVKLVARLKDTGFSKVEYLKGQYGYVRDQDLLPAIKNPETDPNWLAYKADPDGHWFLRAFQAKLDYSKWLEKIGNSSGQFKSWAGLYTFFTGSAFAGEQYDGTTCGKRMEAQLDAYHSIYEHLDRNFEHVFVWSEGDSIVLTELFLDSPRQRPLQDGTFRSNKIRTDFRKDRVFRKFGQADGNFNHRFWLDERPWYSLVDKSLAVARRKPKDLKDKVFHGVYRCDQDRTQQYVESGISDILELALSSQPGMIFHDVDFYLAGENGGKEDVARWEPHMLNSAEANDLSLPMTTTDHLFDWRNEENDTNEKGYFSLLFVVPASACWFAGCREGDVVLKIDGRPVSSLSGNEELKIALRKLRNESVKVTVWRNGQTLDLKVDRRTRFEHFQEALERALAGDAEAMLAVGKVLEDFVRNVVALPGKSSLAARYNHSVFWIRKAAEAGHVPAMIEYGIKRRAAHGVPRNDKAAKRWFRKAVDVGENAKAMNELASQYRYGRGVEDNNREQEISWLRKAVGQAEAVGDRSTFRYASTSLAKIYDEGNDVPQNVEEAISWYEKAAEYGHEGSMVRLGDILRAGDGVEKDRRSAFEWYEKAAKVGDDKGMVRLAQMYDQGWGTKQDRQKAVDLVFSSVKSARSYSDDRLNEFKEWSADFTPEFRKSFQKEMKDAGVYKGKIDGDFGPGTMQAVKALSELE